MSTLLFSSEGLIEKPEKSVEIKLHTFSLSDDLVQKQIMLLDRVIDS